MTDTKTFIMTFLIIIAPTWKQPKYPSTEEGMNKLQYFYAMKYELLRKKKKKGRDKGRGGEEDEEEGEERKLQQKIQATTEKTLKTPH